MLGLKISLSAIILTLILFTGGNALNSAELAYGQFFETNSSELTSNSTSSENSNSAEIVLLSQKLKKASFGYRDLVGQVKNIGSDTAESVKIVLDTFDKNGNVLGTDYTYATADTLKPNQRSSFDMSSQSQNFKGMDHYEISLQWRNSDGTEGYVENAKIYKDNTATKTETETETDHSFSTQGDDSSKTRPLCDTVANQSGKDLCETLLR